MASCKLKDIIEDWSSHIVFYEHPCMTIEICCESAGNIKEFDLPTIDKTI